MIAEETSDGYESKKITGHEIIGRAQTGMQPTLVSGENIKTLNETSLLGSGDIEVQRPLISGTNIKTLNETSLLGTGNISVQPTLVSGTNIKTINSNSLLGSGNITVNTGVSLIAKKTMVTNVGLGTNVLIASEDISAHLTTSAMIQVTATYRKTAGGASSVLHRMYVNSTPSLSGATLICNFQSLTSVNNIMDAVLNIFTDGTNLYLLGVSTLISSRYGQYAGTVITIPSPCYLIWGLQTPNGDTLVMLNSNVIKYA
ncbi:MAG: hypothetical protein EBR91_11260 [Flavobacteriia bacterium]|nr:hypothetical protein [Flavobacteriia bacterium]